MIWLESKPIAEKMKEEDRAAVAALGFAPRLAIVYVGENPVIETFISLKEAYAREVGVNVHVRRFPPAISGNKLREELKTIVHSPAHEPVNHAVVIQLPLPDHIDPPSILDGVREGQDVDVLSSGLFGKFKNDKSPFVPPMVGAVQSLLEYYRIDVEGRIVAIVGWGLLVGQPLSVWCAQQKAISIVINVDDASVRECMLPLADIVISGVEGKQKFITSDLIKKGAAVIDAAHNVDENSVKEKADFLTPQRGGVGPLTVAFLIRNTIKAAMLHGR